MVLLENSEMRFLKLFIYSACLQLTIGVAVAQSKPKPKPKLAGKICSADEILRFKTEYIKLQNALKHEGKSIELKNGKSNGFGDSTEYDQAPGQQIEEALYKQYKNALIKVGKIYQKNSTDAVENKNKFSNDNPDVAKFFMAIDSDKIDNKLVKDLSTDKLLGQLAKNQVVGFELNDGDIYLLKKLLIHAQDRICTLEKYKSNAKRTANTSYLEQLYKSPLNKMIESLRSLDKTQDLKLAKEDIAISEAVKDSMAKLKAILVENNNCKIKLMNSPMLGDLVQSCNYKKFIQSISANQLNDIEAILHFINANQKAKNARTDLEWVNNQFKKESVAISCYVDPESKAVYVPNFPYKSDGKAIDTTNLSCTNGTSKILTKLECADGLDITFVTGMGFKVSAKKQDSKKPLLSFSIKGAEDCNSVSLVQPSVPKLSPEEECKKDSKKDWVDNKCIEKPVVALTPEEECKKDPKKDWVDNKCIDKPVALTEEECKKDPKKDWVDNKCIDKPVVALTPEEECKKDPKKDWVGNICVDKPAVASTPEEVCKKQDKDWIAAAVAPDIRTSRYNWDEKTKKCIDKQAEKSEDNGLADENFSGKEDVIYADKPVPGRFQPVQIPTRQMYILPGMP
jgi:hypothetical protein